MKKLLLLIPLILILLPLFHSGLFDVHDPTSILRFATLSGTLGSGQFPATWTNSLNQGYGYPLFLYYAPVFSYRSIPQIVSPYLSHHLKGLTSCARVFCWVWYVPAHETIFG